VANQDYALEKGFFWLIKEAKADKTSTNAPIPHIPPAFAVNAYKTRFYVAQEYVEYLAGLSSEELQVEFDMQVRQNNLSALELCGIRRRPKGKTTDEVNSPSHYTDGNIEVIDFLEDKSLDYHLGNVVKYVCRAGKKDPAKEVQDLEKAAWYLNRKITNLKNQK